MLAVVTAEWTQGGTGRLEALGYEVRRVGWGLTRQVLPREQLIEVARGASLLLTEIEAVDEQVLGALPRLRLVGTARGGPVNVDLPGCRARGIPVLFTPARNAESVADFTVGLVLSLTRGLPAADAHLRADGWHVAGELPYLHFRGPELGRLTVGVVGHGACGSRVARRLREGFGSTVLVSDPAVAGSLSLEELADRCDVLTLHCPRSPATTGLVGADLLARLRPSSYVVNTAGGGIVDEDALCDALDAGRLCGAALDCFATEPLPRDSRLLRTRGLLLTPHLAGAALDVVGHHTDMLVGDVERWHRGDPLVHRAV